MVIRSEHARSPVPRMLVQPVHGSTRNDASAISNQEVIQYQPWHGVEGMPPPRSSGRHSQGESGFGQQSPGGLRAAASKIEIGAQNHGVLHQSCNQVSSL